MKGERKGKGPLGLGLGVALAYNTQRRSGQLQLASQYSQTVPCISLQEKKEKKEKDTREVEEGKGRGRDL